MSIDRDFITQFPSIRCLTRFHSWLAASVFALAISNAARAGITATGDVFPNPPNFGSHVTLGQDTVGHLEIDGGSVLSTGPASIGVFGVGTAVGTGLQSAWSMPFAEVGIEGFGQLVVHDQGRIEIQNGSLEIARDAGSLGTVIADDLGSLLRVADSIAVGIEGTGRLEAKNGAVVHTGGALDIGGNRGNGGHGTVLLEGVGTLLKVDQGVADIGRQGGGVLQVRDDAVADFSNGQMEIGPLGRVELHDGLVRTGEVFNSGLIRGSGEILAPFNGQFENSGRVEAESGDHLVFTGQSGDFFQNDGILSASSGEIEIRSMLRNQNNNEAGGKILLSDGVLRLVPFDSFDPSQLLNEGLLASTGGSNQVHGQVRNDFQADIAVTNESVLVFHDEVVNVGGVISVFAGSKAVFLDDLRIDGGTLLANIAGSDDETGYGVAEIVGQASLRGSLDVALAGGYEPQAGDRFQVLTAGGGIMRRGGIFSLRNVPELPVGLAWDLDVGTNQVVLSVLSTVLAGDFNSDGAVDAADYTVWRDHLGAGDESALGGNGDGIGGVDQGDYDLWKANFGATLGGRSGAIAGASSVPEPGSAALALFCMTVSFGLCRRNF